MNPDAKTFFAAALETTRRWGAGGAQSFVESVTTATRWGALIGTGWGAANLLLLAFAKTPLTAVATSDLFTQVGLIVTGGAALGVLASPVIAVRHFLSYGPGPRIQVNQTPEIYTQDSANDRLCSLLRSNDCASTLDRHHLVEFMRAFDNTQIGAQFPQAITAFVAQDVKPNEFGNALLAARQIPDFFPSQSPATIQLWGTAFQQSLKDNAGSAFFAWPTSHTLPKFFGVIAQLNESAPSILRSLPSAAVTGYVTDMLNSGLDSSMPNSIERDMVQLQRLETLRQFFAANKDLGGGECPLAIDRVWLDIQKQTKTQRMELSSKLTMPRQAIRPSSRIMTDDKANPST